MDTRARTRMLADHTRMLARLQFEQAQIAEELPGEVFLGSSLHVSRQQSQCASRVLIVLGGSGPDSAATDAAHQYGSILWERPHWFAESWTGHGHILRMWSWLDSCWVDPREPTRKLDLHTTHTDEVLQHGIIRWYSPPRGAGSRRRLRTWDWDRDCWVQSEDEADNGSHDDAGLDRSWKWHRVSQGQGRVMEGLGDARES